MERTMSVLQRRLLPLLARFSCKISVEKRILPLVSLVAMVLFSPVVLAAGQASPDEAKAMAIKAAEYLKSVGPEKALPAFTAKEGPWHDRDLYVTVEDADGILL